MSTQITRQGKEHWVAGVKYKRKFFSSEEAGFWWCFAIFCANLTLPRLLQTEICFWYKKKDMEEGEKTEEKKVDSPEEMRLHSKEARGLRDSVGGENLIEKQVDRTIESQHFIQYQPSAPPQPKMDQVWTRCDCAFIIIDKKNYHWQITTSTM